MWSNCTQTISEEDWQETTEIVYHYSDPTIAPDYFRKYTLSITAKEAVLTISDYSKELYMKRFPVTAETFTAFVEKLKEMGVKRVKEKEPTATGCDYESLTLIKNDNRYFHAYASCGEGNLKLEKGNLGKVMNMIVPDLEEVVEQTRNN